jgi:hypothetical protein
MSFIFRKDDTVKVTMTKDGNYNQLGTINHPCGDDFYSVKLENGISAVYAARELWLIQKASQVQVHDQS